MIFFLYLVYKEAQQGNNKLSTATEPESQSIGLSLPGVEVWWVCVWVIRE